MSPKRVAKLSLPVRAVGRGTTGRIPAVGQDAAGLDSITCTDEMTFLFSCSGMMYDNDMPFCIYCPFFVLDRVAP